MYEWHPLTHGVLAREHDLDARFTRGSLAGLVAAVRDAVWPHIELFESADVVRVFVGSNRRIRIFT